MSEAKITPLKQIPEPPAELGDVGRAQWKVYCERLNDRGDLMQEYLGGLKELCQLEEQVQQGFKDVDEIGMSLSYRDDEGNVKQSQRSGEFLALMTAIDKVRDMRADYGLTVASRPEDVEKESTYTSKRKKSF